MLPQIQQRMKPGYEAGASAVGGKGKFERIKGAVTGHSERQIDEMFTEATGAMLRAVSAPRSLLVAAAR